ncbi:MAG: SIS domain-containing protein [Geodermatophilaceae bacterium]|nr:SIS domain-containing protein [Geodermatophilaceae bacterium]
MEALYPFLYAEQSDVTPLLRAVAESTADKAREIVVLRQQLAGHFADTLIACAQDMADRFAAGGRLFTFGNGGSSSDAQAVAQLFLNPATDGRALPAVSLTNDVAVLTALSNDVGFEVVFARQLAAQGSAVDIAVGLSTSGGSANVLAGFDQAARRGMLTVGFAGYEGGRMAEADTIDHLFVIPSASVHRIQEAQTTTYNVLWELTQLALR